ncbi:hypothetical protein [Flocculibacter collagenilyticus]|uniref:hypothetical protein n=1 Tax=Flocculibacter collagenilyticus TaxID=2744479 RepID=UPI0018F33679|nr:hypothetical protein [Flocculibacter collagenilyticus]
MKNTAVFIFLLKQLNRLGRNPKKSLRIFLTGLALFLVAVGFIALGYYQSHWYQIIGLVILGFAIIVCALGYIGILANRLAKFWQR